MLASMAALAFLVVLQHLDVVAASAVELAVVGAVVVAFCCDVLLASVRALAVLAFAGVLASAACRASGPCCSADGRSRRGVRLLCGHGMAFCHRLSFYSLLG